MRYVPIGVAVAVIAVTIAPVWAQAPFPAFGQPPPPPASYSGAYSWRFNATTPDDAYRKGLINRWELEQLVGPTPQALQGPSPNGRSSAPGSN